MNDLTLTSAAETFRANAAGHFHDAADMTLHQLVDEYQRLALIVEAGTTEKNEDGFYAPELTPEAELASRQQQIINGAARARFAISFSSHDLSF